MKFLGLLLVTLYTALMLFALLQAKTKSLGILLGCLLLAVYVTLRIFGKDNPVVLLIGGMLAISLGTLLNGIRQGDVHIHHHLIRLAVEALLTALCWRA
ncbi:MAG: hypothetical protein NC337_13045 [Roseburia sp.]|nr:hypothetical protein [Roseburia sp.]